MINGRVLVLEVSLDGGQTFITIDRLIFRSWDLDYWDSGPEFAGSLIPEGIEVQDDPYAEVKKLKFQEI
jgi:hypothetical protein